MHISHAAFLFTMLCLPSAGQATQSPSNGGATQNPSGQNTPAPPAQETRPNPSVLLQPSLDTLQAALSAVKLDKWKGGNVRTEAGSNISSIQRDLQSTLPPLVKTADAAPRTISTTLPVSRNIDALYDVLLRVVDGARIAAPSDQFNQLQDAMTSVEKARHALDDQIQEMVTAEEKQVNDLQVSLKAKVVPVCPVAPPPPPPSAPAKKVTPKKKRKPPTTQQPNAQPSGSSQPSATAKPNQ